MNKTMAFVGSHVFHFGTKKKKKKKTQKQIERCNYSNLLSRSLDVYLYVCNELKTEKVYTFLKNI